MRKPFNQQSYIERVVTTASFTQLLYWAKRDDDLAKLAQQEIEERLKERYG